MCIFTFELKTLLINKYLVKSFNRWGGSPHPRSNLHPWAQYDSFLFWLTGDRAVYIGLHSSSSINCGVPQGSILGPLLFSLYMLPLVSMFNNYIFSLIRWLFQIYLPVPETLEQYSCLFVKFISSFIRSFIHFNF